MIPTALIFSEEGIGNGILRTPLAKALKERGFMVDAVASARLIHEGYVEHHPVA